MHKSTYYMKITTLLKLTYCNYVVIIFYVKSTFSNILQSNYNMNMLILQ